MLTFGASVLTKVPTRAESLPAPKPAVLAATTLAAAGRRNSVAAGPTPSSTSNRKLLLQADLQLGARSAPLERSPTFARKAAARRKDVDGNTVTREQHSEFVMKSAFSRFKCATCGQGYSSAGSLALHERVHRGEKPYVCPLCGEGFTTAAKLHLHNISERNGSNGARQNWGKEKQPEGEESEQAGSGEEKKSLERQKSLRKKANLLAFFQSNVGSKIN